MTLSNLHHDCNTSTSTVSMSDYNKVLSPLSPLLLFLFLSLSLSTSFSFLFLVQTSLKIGDNRRSAAAIAIAEKIDLDTPGNSSDYDPSFLSDSYVEGDEVLHEEQYDRMRINESEAGRERGRQGGRRRRGEDKDDDVLTSANAFSEDGMT